MQEYLHRTRLSSLMDGIGFHFAALTCGIMWFALLWGLRLSAVTAGLSLYALILLIRSRTRDSRVKRKEKQLRERIGGELALERLLLSPREQANFEAAMLLSLRAPLTLLRTGEEGTLCSLRGEKLLISFVQSPQCDTIQPGQVLALQRGVRRMKAQSGVLCAPCGISQKAKDQAEESVPVRFIDREKLIRLFGRVNPATDEQLVALGRRKKSRPAVGWLRVVLDRQRARRYFCYGGLLLLMYQFTHLIYYALPGLICVCLAAVSRCFPGNDPILE